MTGRTGSIFLVIALAVCLVAPARAAAGEANVLVLIASPPYGPTFLANDGAMREVLANDPSRHTNVYAESMDTQRFALETLEPEFVALLAKKYGKVRIDVVVAVSRPALDFFMRNGAQLWPGARLVYQGFSLGSAGPGYLPPEARAVAAPEDVQAVADLARRMQPGARRIAVITGSADIDLRYERLARAALATVAPLEVEYLSGLPLPELLERIAPLGPDSIVLYLTQLRDRAGKPYVSRDVLSAVARLSRAPVYGVIEASIGAGAVAVVAESQQARGRLVAQQVLAALDGGPPDPARRVLLSPSACAADARALKRLGLDEGRLPPGCEIRFPERSFWREYFWGGLAGLAVIAAQALLIGGLLVQMRRRRTAEAESRKRFSEMAHMNRRIAMGEMSASIAHELSQPLGAIRANAAAARLMLRGEPPQLGEIPDILDDIIRDDVRASDIIARVRKMVAKAEFQVQDIDLNATIDETTGLLAEEAAIRGVTLESELDGQLPPVSADPVEVKQVLVNLALNAMEAMQAQPQAQRRLTVRTRRANGREAEVSVRDCGIGIPADLIDRIFEPFVSSKSSGMGLGLAISRTIVETHGGSMRAENGPAGGAVISFTLPLAAGHGTA